MPNRPARVPRKQTNASLSRPCRLVRLDPLLAPYAETIHARMRRFAQVRASLVGEGGTLSEFANGYLYFGLHPTEEGWVFREWAPGADAVFLMGDFNGWSKTAHPLRRLPGGVWEIALPGGDALRHGQYYALWLQNGQQAFQRTPSYATWVAQDEKTFSYTARVPDPAPYAWKNAGYTRRKTRPLCIYEAHVGMAQEEEGIGTYRAFADRILPRIQKAGYTAVQLMGIAEHPYYASFGYQVTGFYAPSSWFGTPDDLRYLVDTAHGLGLDVIMDLVHSHSAVNEGDGLNRFDGTDGQYFHRGDRGTHPAWGTRLFDYGKHQVLHFLLSNIKYWLSEFRVDGFRFDGVTSMLYRDHGLGRVFSGYADYFGENVDPDAVTYLQLAADLVHEVRPDAVAIAEDMSGMPGMCLPVQDGGLGFDYRLSMGIPDFWIKTLREKTDEQWDMGSLWHELTTCRPAEKVVAYCESHDQALVGDKTLMFWLADASMYTDMDRACHTPEIDRAMAMHKLIRLVTIALSGDGWLSFMGNEFGHPEWIDFPREGNGWSYRYARRQWSLVDNGYLKYSLLAAFDRAMLRLMRTKRVLAGRRKIKLWDDFDQKLLVFARQGLIFAFNFHPTRSQEGFAIPVGAVGGASYRLLLDTDREEFGGQGRIAADQVFPVVDVAGKGPCVRIYLPCRTAVVLARQKE